jgi:hypothetical protein
MGIEELLKFWPIIPEVKKIKSPFLKRLGFRDLVKIAWLGFTGISFAVSWGIVMFVMPPLGNVETVYSKFQTDIFILNLFFMALFGASLYLLVIYPISKENKIPVQLTGVTKTLN